MTHSEREAALEDDEEWLNIPDVLRAFLRRLSNDVQCTSLACAGFMKYQRDNDRAIRRIHSKQRESEAEISKMALITEQHQQQTSSWVRETMETIANEVHILKEETSRLSGDIQQLGKREACVCCTQRSSNVGPKFISELMTSGFTELKAQIGSEKICMDREITSLKDEIALISGKHVELVSESKEGIKCLNSSLRQLEDWTREEVNNLKVRLCKQQELLDALSEDYAKQSEKVSRQEKTLSTLCDELDSAVSLVKDNSVSSDERFKTVFNSLQRLECLTSKFSTTEGDGAQELCSLLDVIREIRAAHRAMADELRGIVQQQLSKIERETSRLKASIRGIHRTYNELTERISHLSACTVSRKAMDEVHSRLDKLEHVATRESIRMEVRGVVEEIICDKRASLNGSYQKLHDSISEMQARMQVDVDHVRNDVIGLRSEFGAVVSTCSNIKCVEESLRSLVKKASVHEVSVADLREELLQLKGVMDSRTTRAYPTSMTALSEMGRSCENVPCDLVSHLKDIVTSTCENQVSELKMLVNRDHTELERHEAELKEMFRLLMTFEGTMKERTRSYHRFVSSVEERLSTTMLDCDRLREQIVSLGAQSSHPRVSKGLCGPDEHVDEKSSSSALPNIEQVVLTVLGAQQQNLVTNSLCEKFQTLLSDFEDKMRTVVWKTAEASDKTRTNEDKLLRDPSNLREEEMRLHSRVLVLEEKLSTLEGVMSLSREKISMNATDVLNLHTSVEALGSDVRRLERNLSSCLTSTSQEWSCLYGKVDRCSNFAESYNAERVASCAELSRIGERLVFCEEELSCMKKKMCELTRQFDDNQSVIRSNAQLVRQTEDVACCHQSSLISLEKRLSYAEESLQAAHLLVSVYLKDAFDFTGSCLEMLKASVNETDCRLSDSASSRTADGVSHQPVALEERIVKIESDLAELRGNGIFKLQRVNGTVLERISSLEAVLTACSEEVTETKNGLSLCHEQIKHMKQCLQAKGACRAAEECGFLLSADSPVNNGEETTSASAITRLAAMEMAVTDFKQRLLAKEDDLCGSYTKSQVDNRFESMWVSLLALLARKEDHDAVNGKLMDLKRSVLDEVAVRIDNLFRELSSAISERVRITEVHELLLGMRG